MYKIRDKNTGLFSSGGMTPKWSTIGKTYNNLGTLKSHLRQHISHYTSEKGRHYKDLPENWELVEYDIIESDGISLDIVSTQIKKM